AWRASLRLSAPVTTDEPRVPPPVAQAAPVLPPPVAQAALPEVPPRPIPAAPLIPPPADTKTPTGRQPVATIARLNEKGQILLSLPEAVTSYVQKTVRLPGRDTDSTVYESVTTRHCQWLVVLPDGVRAAYASGKKISAKKLRE